MPSKPLLKIVGKNIDKEEVLPKRTTLGDEERGIASQSVASHYRSAERMSVPQVLSTVICLIALAWPGLSAAAYLIQLRNGRHVTTWQYWKEGHSIMFYTAGGVGGVPESAVLRIQTVEDPPESGLAGAAEQPAAPQTEQKITPPAEQKVTPPAAVQRDGEKMFKLDLEAYRQKKEEIQSQLNTAVERYREASGPENKEEKAKLQQEITAWSKQLFDLRDGIKKKYQGRLPEGWENF
jgi:hypothetical protein